MMTESVDDSIYRPTIPDLPLDERPRERLKNYGAAALSNAELLAILLRTGRRGENVVAFGLRLLTEFGGLPGLTKAGFNELIRVNGMGLAKTAQLKATLELSRRLLLASPDTRPQI